MQCSEVKQVRDVPCGEIKSNRLDKVFFNTETGEVLDKDKNYIGQGEMREGLLVITQSFPGSTPDTR